MFMLFLHGFMAVDGGAGVEKQTITVLMNEFFITWEEALIVTLRNPSDSSGTNGVSKFGNLIIC